MPSSNMGVERMIIQEPNFERFKGGSNDSIDTSQSRYYQRAFKIGVSFIDKKIIKKPSIDPFARDCTWADVTNDLDTSKKAMFNLDALNFIKTFENNSIKLILFDPPFSTSQEKKYAFNSNLYAADSNKISQLYKEAFRVLSPGGVMVKLGYNSTRPHPGLKLKHLILVNFGGSRNDVIVSIWRKEQTTLDLFLLEKNIGDEQE